MNEADFDKRVYGGRIEGEGVRGRTLVRWINRVVRTVEKVLADKGLSLLWGNAGIRKAGDIFVMATPLEEFS